VTVKISRQERQARTATLNTLSQARTTVGYGSVEEIFLYHAGHHCLELWLSEAYGYQVRITEVDDEGYTITRIG